MTRAIIINQTGGPEVLKLTNIAEELPGKGQVLIHQTAIGINFLDIHQRSGAYKINTLPCILGVEACGYIEKIGEGVEGYTEGDRVAYATAPGGAYSERRVIDTKYLVGVPELISDQQVAAILLKGLTAHYLLKRVYFVKQGDIILVHAAAGGVGSLLCQWAKALKAIVIGTVGSEEKIPIAKANGCKYVINLKNENFLQKVMEITNGQGVHVVYDGIGRDTFENSVECLMTFGLMVSYGQASGAIPPIDLKIFAKKSTFFTRPSLFTYKENKMELVLSANELFDCLNRKEIKDNLNKSYKFEDVASAHRDMEQRKNTGSTILVV